MTWLFCLAFSGCPQWFYKTIATCCAFNVAIDARDTAQWFYKTIATCCGLRVFWIYR